MASFFSHAIASVAIGRAMLFRERMKFWLLGITCAVIPDGDFIGFKLGIPYESVFGHRGFTHSFFFALLLALITMLLFYRAEKIFSRRWNVFFFFFFLSTASHSLIDALTNGGLGVAFFSPFSNERYFFPWQPIEVSPLGIQAFFSERGLKVLKNEMLWVILPSLLLMLFPLLMRKKNSAEK